MLIQKITPNTHWKNTRENISKSDVAKDFAKVWTQVTAIDQKSKYINPRFISPKLSEAFFFSISK
jgi:hypothetical protein